MKRLIRFIDKCGSFGGGLAGLMLCVALALIVAEIVLRGCFNSTLLITDEYSGYLMVGATFCALSYTLRERGHIRMTFLHRIVTGRPRLYLDVACFAIGLVFSAGLTYFTAQLFWDSVVTQTQSMQISETYLAIPQFFMPLGAFLLTIQFVGEICKSLLALKADTAGLLLNEEAPDLGR